ncbi:Alpha/Beta hydrolase protein [Papiliotrema laurentii]|uniref:Carboxylic ester hydrolase n=1 Tax=Papiliotrema laurentii TaxID=5418 RepID=A0AAD9FWZ8_PAPLA|nr:Alpha/Beta hydrolase protein [Papiliotrema laurentii]
MNLLSLLIASLSFGHVFCMPIGEAPIKSSILAPRAPGCSIGDIRGVETSSGACRYTLRYAEVKERWGYSQLPSITSSSKLPIFVWVHGGSFVSGSASAPGLDGSTLAQGGIIVIVIQYRLGVLGFLPPSLAASSNDPNLGLLDLINGLSAIQNYATSFGGDAGRVTLGGQSAGAGMIRSLLGVPSAKGLFESANLQSDPLSYGLASTMTTAQLRDAYYSAQTLSTCSSLKCLQSLSLGDILKAQDDLLSYAPYTFEAVPLAEVILPTYGTNIIPNDPTPILFNSPNSLPISTSDISLLMTTTKNEGGSAVQQLFPVPVPPSNKTLVSALTALVGEDRAEAIAKVPAYTSSVGGADGMRGTFEKIVTDGVWRCPNRAAARSWAKAGGKVWVAEWLAGSTYPTNTGSYCQGADRVCHEDDIYPTFGTAPISFPEGVGNEVLAAWSTFINNGTPTLPTGGKGNNVRDYLRQWSDYLKEKAKDWLGQLKEKAAKWHSERGVETWARYTGDDSTVFAIGDGEALACPAGWGDQVKYNWQMYP